MKMQTRIGIGIALALLTLPLTAIRVSAQQPGTVPALGNLDKTVILSPGDVIQIQVDNHDELDRTYTVPIDGRLLIPQAGSIQVAGLTAVAVRDKIQTALERTLNNVFVRVEVQAIHSRRVTLMGDFRNTGPLDMGVSVWRLSDVIATAQLLAPSSRLDAKPSEYIVKLTRDTKSRELDLTKALADQEGADNIVIMPGDRITAELKPLNSLRHQMHILGQIPRQGTYDIDSSTTVLSLFGQAGFPSPNAALSSSYVLRGSQEILLDLRPLIEGNPNEKATQFKFQDNDILYIPDVKLFFVAWGQVARQGNYVYPEHGTLLLSDALNLIGPQQGADLTHVHVLRMVNGKQTDVGNKKKPEDGINFEHMIKKGTRDDNIVIMPNDMIFIPPKSNKHKISIGDVFSGASVLYLFQNLTGFRFFQ